MYLLFPELSILLTAILVLIYDMFNPTPNRKIFFGISFTGLLLSGTSLLFPFFSGKVLSLTYFFSNLYLVDHLSIFFKGIALLTGILFLFLNYNFFGALVKRREGEFLFLFLISIFGLMITASSTNLLIIYLGLEMIAFTSYLLTGWQKNIDRSREGAVKYFILGAVSSAIFLYGISIFYGLTGSLDIAGLAVANHASNLVFFISLFFIFIGIGFKIAMFPMQFWSPDVYEGAPTSVTAYLSVGPKAIGFALLIRFMTLLQADFIFIIAILSVLTMTWGNIVAISQTNIKRFLAYSSIAQAGYIMVGLVAGSFGYQAIAFYILAYTFANLGVFALVAYLSTEFKSEELSSFSGLASRSPFVALTLTFLLLSLIGLPPTSGFIAKFLVFKSALNAGYIWLVIFGLLNSLIAAYYYLKIISLIYFKKGEESTMNIPVFITFATLICAVATLLLGILPNFVIALLSYIK